MEEPLVELLHDCGYRGRGAPVFIQSFEVANLHQDLDELTNLRLVKLSTATGAPEMFTAAGDSRTYAEFVTPVSLSV